MKIRVKKFDGANSVVKEYAVNSTTESALNILENIKINQDNSLCYRSGCKSGICGSCAVTINGVEKLLCKTKLNDDDLIEPIKNSKVIKDLIVDLNYQEKILKKAKAFLKVNTKEEISRKDEKLIDLQSTCILCQSCYSSCPVYEVNKNFLGPYVLTRNLRYINDKKELNIKESLNEIQKDGVWDCTLCGNCTLVCPQTIDPKNDIMILRMKSIQNGFEDPTYQNNQFSNEFNMDSGFNPNGF